METFKCCQCHEVKPVQKDYGTGYAVKKNGYKVCYLCCGIIDRQKMIEDGKISLYLTKEYSPKNKYNHGKSYQWFVSNWPGTYKVQVYNVREGHHNISGVRYDVRFFGPDGYVWYGRLCSDNTQLFTTRRTKETYNKDTNTFINGVREEKIPLPWSVRDNWGLK